MPRESRVQHKKKAQAQRREAGTKASKTLSNIKVIAPTFAVLLIVSGLFIRSNAKYALSDHDAQTAFENMLPANEEEKANAKDMSVQLTSNTEVNLLKQVDAKNSEPRAVTLPIAIANSPANSRNSSTAESVPATIMQAGMPASKVLQKQDMEQILARLKKEAPARNSNNQCLQIRKSVNCNVGNAFELAEFLRMNGYSIAGRKTTTVSSTGIAIQEIEGCIVVTVGFWEK